MIDARELVHFIVWLARERGERLTTIRVVKFLYLADLYFARENGGQTLTGWPWAFVHFGPFCGEALDAIQASATQGRVTATRMESRYGEKDYYIYATEDSGTPNLRDTLPLYVAGPLQDAIRKWADDTPALLDNVYFHTEPMVDARPGDRLDFSKAMRSEPSHPLSMTQLSGHKIRQAREAAKALAERYRKGVETLRAGETAVYDADFIEALRAMGDSEPSPTEPVRGTARLRSD